MQSILQLSLTTTSILELSDQTELDKTEIRRKSEFIITVKSTQQEVDTKRSNDSTDQYNYEHVINSRDF